MANIRQFIGKLLFLALGFCLFSYATNAKNKPVTDHGPAPSTHVFHSYDFNFIAIVPEKATLPMDYGLIVAVPVSDRKPDNTNYQIIRNNTLGLVNAQMNI